VLLSLDRYFPTTCGGLGSRCVLVRVLDERGTLEGGQEATTRTSAGCR
jgi:hypothetical protein